MLGCESDFKVLEYPKCILEFNSPFHLKTHWVLLNQASFERPGFAQSPVLAGGEAGRPSDLNSIQDRLSSPPSGGQPEITGPPGSARDSAGPVPDL